MIFDPINEKTNFKKNLFLEGKPYLFKKKIYIRAEGGEPAMVLR